MKLFALLSAAALSVVTCTASFGQITGKVTLDGKAPEMQKIVAIKQVAACAKMHKDPLYEETVVTGDKGELANVVVAIKPADGQQLPGSVPSKPALLDQKGCQYKPHVIAVMAGQEVIVRNSDDFMHNVHSLAIDNQAFNFGQPNKGDKKLEPLKAVEAFKVKCDVHPWMSAWVKVVEHPYFAVTGEDGTFSIDTKGLPDGDYTISAWQEAYQDQDVTGKVSVKGGKADKPLDLHFKARDKSAQAKPVKELHLASLESKDADCCDTKAEKNATVAQAK